jgi:hypothetical protein
MKSWVLVVAALLFLNANAFAQDQNIYVVRACAQSEPVAPESSQRAQVLLNGTWQGATTQSPSDQAPDGTWSARQVPGMSWIPPRGGAHYLWLRRDISIPATWTGRRVVLDLRGAKYDPHVYVDGKLAGSQFNGLKPFACDITELVKPGQTHRLEVRCQDMTAVLMPGFIWKEGESDEALRGKILRPLAAGKKPWGRGTMCGSNHCRAITL